MSKNIVDLILGKGIVASLGSKKGLFAALAVSAVFSCAVLPVIESYNSKEMSQREDDVFVEILIAKATLKSPDFYSSGNYLSENRNQKNYSVKLLYQIGDGETDYPNSIKSVDFTKDIDETRSKQILGDNGREIQTIRLYEVTETNDGGERKKSHHLVRSRISDNAIIMQTEISLFNNGSLDVDVFNNLARNLAQHEAGRAGAIQRMRDVVYNQNSPEPLSAEQIQKSFSGHLEREFAVVKTKLASNLSSGETYISVNYPEEGLAQKYKTILSEHRLQKYSSTVKL